MGFKFSLFVGGLESQRPANKRRKRKGSNSGGAANNAQPAPNKKRSPGPNFSLASQVREKIILLCNYRYITKKISLKNK